MATKIVDPEYSTKLATLHAERVKAHKRVEAAIRTRPRGLVLEGDALRRIQEEDAKCAAIMRLIREMQE